MFFFLILLMKEGSGFDFGSRFVSIPLTNGSGSATLPSTLKVDWLFCLFPDKLDTLFIYGFGRIGIMGTEPYPVLHILIHMDLIHYSLIIYMGVSGESEICMVTSGFYGLVSYAIGITVIMSLAGIKVGRRFYRHRSRHSSANRPSTEEEPAPSQQIALDMVDLMPETRAPPTRDPTEVPFEDVMASILRGNRSINPFY
jgi:hypothetical protein